jgi:hypothetical protein
MKKIIFLLILISATAMVYSQSPSPAVAREAVRDGERVEQMLDDYQTWMDNFLLSNENQKKFKDYNDRLHQIMLQANYWRLRFQNRWPNVESRQVCADNHRAELKKYQDLRKERDAWLESVK